jgi:hypothetical protein
MSREDLARQIMEVTQQATQVDPQANLAQKNFRPIRFRSVRRK